MKCSAMNSKKAPCGNHAVIGKDKCIIHFKPDETESIKMYKKELKRMHEKMRLYSRKCSDLNNKMMLIHRVDYIKHELLKLATQTPFRTIIANPMWRDDIESIFQMPYEEIREAYDKMLNERNAIVHKYTLRSWVP